MNNIKIKNKLLVSIIILFFVISLGTIVTAKYVIEYENVIGKINLDRKPPLIKVNYSTKEPTGENVLVTLISDEPLIKIEGFNISDDKLKLTKIYENNIKETITIKDLVGNETKINIEIENIDKKSPYIELIEIKNSNFHFENFASHIHKMNFKVKIYEENILINNFNTENIIVKLENNTILSNNIQIQEIQKDEEGIIYEIGLNKVEGNGYLTLVIKDSIIMDIGNRWNDELIINSGITIDNINPNVSYTEEKQESGKSLINVISDEGIRDVKEWSISEDNKTISKEFTNNISFILEITDYAENKTKIEIEVKTATYIKLTYSSQNSEVGWSFGYGNNDIAGEEAIKRNPKFKTESLAFNVEGNIEKDFIQARAYVHTYWGEGILSRCEETGLEYKYGYNPENTRYKSMNSSDLVKINEKKYFQFGGSGINKVGKTDINGNNPIPLTENGLYKYGISSIKIKLKDYSYYSIIYQIYVNGQGWLNVASDGEEAVYKYDKPMSAIRISLVPKSEKQNAISLWQKEMN